MYINFLCTTVYFSNISNGSTFIFDGYSAARNPQVYVEGVLEC
jgi:hypothetical protein